MASCSVCLEAFKRPTTCIPCGHMFCYQCINNWRQTHSNSNVCPQCRCNIKQLQRIYIGDSNNLEVSENKENCIINISANRLHWFREQLDTVWLKLKQFHDWGRHDHVDLDDEHNNEDSTTFIDYLQNQTERVQAVWRDLQTSQKLVISCAIVLLISLVYQDAQSPNGFLHGLIFPVLELIGDFTWSMTSSLLFIFFRPLYCVWNIVSELFITVFEIVYTIMYAVISSVFTVLLIPYAIFCAICMWAFVILSYFCETVLAIFRLAVISVMIFVTYLFAVDLEKRKQVLNLVVTKYQNMYSALPSKSQAIISAQLFRDNCVAFVRSVRQKVREQNPHSS